jgi:hypothetical protein
MPTCTDEVTMERIKREESLSRVRSELRRAHRSLSEEQVDLIAAVAMEIRSTRVRLGYPRRVPGAAARAEVST